MGGLCDYGSHRRDDNEPNNTNNHTNTNNNNKQGLALLQSTSTTDGKYGKVMRQSQFVS
jgi:hypothetical protein